MVSYMINSSDVLYFTNATSLEIYISGIEIEISLYLNSSDVLLADLLALVCGVFCEFVTFPLVSWVRCGT